MNASEDSAKNDGRVVVGAQLPSAGEAAEDPIESGWSALMDGCLSGDELQDLFEKSSIAQVRGQWQAYLTVGDALRGDCSLVPTTPAAEFLSRFQVRLQAEMATGPQVAVVVETNLNPVKTGQLRATAANDASFRWKMVAMAASVSAVMAVSWSLIGGSAGGASTGQPVLAAVEAPRAPVQPQAVAASLPEAPVIVNTTQGPLIRDARLEALLAEHRQYGGMSALQMPAGFLRNATYDAPER